MAKASATKKEWASISGLASDINAPSPRPQAKGERASRTDKPSARRRANRPISAIMRRYLARNGPRGQGPQAQAQETSSRAQTPSPHKGADLVFLIISFGGRGADPLRGRHGLGSHRPARRQRVGGGSRPLRKGDIGRTGRRARGRVETRRVLRYGGGAGFPRRPWTLPGRLASH